MVLRGGRPVERHSDNAGSGAWHWWADEAGLAAQTDDALLQLGRGRTGADWLDRVGRATRAGPGARGGLLQRGCRGERDGFYGGSSSVVEDVCARGEPAGTDP